MSYPHDRGQGYGQQGMMPGMYAPPPPGMFGVTAGAFQAQNLRQQQGAIHTGGANAGLSAVTGMAAIPGMAVGAVGVGSMVASMGGMAAMQNPSLVAGGTKGFAATKGMGGAMRAGYAGMAAMDAVDPFTIAMRGMGAGGRMGMAAGSARFGTMAAGRAAGMAAGGGFMGAGQAAIGQAFSQGGMRAGMGMAARFGGAAAMGGAGAMAAAVPMAAAGYGAYKAGSYATGQMRQGARDSLMGQGLMNQIGPGVAPGQSMRGQGAETGRMMRGMATDMNTGMEDIGRVAKKLNSQRVFQTTRSAKEFRDKFKKVMGAVKEIAKITQGSIDDAAKMFTDLRSQGFYTTADIKAQSASRQARESTTGISAGVYSAVGGAGAQMARQHGMRGRFGSRMAEQSVAGVAMGVRSGRMSEEEVNEQGGIEQVGMRMAQKQMGFMKSSRGRAMIAYSMGKGGAPDQDRLQKMLSGVSMEELVTGAAGRGLGTLRAAGGREAREKFSQYAGMGMVSMAASQHKQLYGGKADRKGIVNMMGTMGVGREEANLMIQQTIGMSKQLAAEQKQKSTDATRASYEDLQKNSSVSGKARAFLDRNVGEGLRGFGSRVQESVSNSYTRNMEKMVGGRVYSGGDEELANRFRASGASLEDPEGRERSRLFGASSGTDRLREQYSEVTYGKSRGGKGEMDLGGGRFAQKEDINRLESSAREGREEGLSKKQQARLNLSVSRGDYLQRLQGKMKSQTGEMEYGAERNRAMNKTGTGASTEFAQYDAAQEAGLVGKQESFTQYTNRSVEDRTKIGAQVQKGMTTAAAKGGDAQGRLLNVLGKEKETGLMGVRTLQMARDQFEADMLSGLSGGKKGGGGSYWGGSGAKGATSGQKSLANKLTTKGDARLHMSNYMQLLSGGGKDKDPEELERLEDLLKNTLSEEEMGEVQKLRQTMEGTGAEADALKEAWGEGGKQQKAMTGLAYREQVEGDLEGLAKRGRAALKSGDLTKRQSSLVSSMTDSKDLSKRRGAMSSMIMEAIESDGGVSKQEREAMNAVGGGAAGQGVADTVDQLRKGKGARVDQLRSQGHGSELDAITKETDPAQQAQMIAEVLKAAGLDDLAAFANGERGDSVEGVQTKYIAANEQFVSTVAAFVSSLGLSEGEVKKVQQAHADMAGENTE